MALDAAVEGGVEQFVFFSADGGNRVRNRNLANEFQDGGARTGHLRVADGGRWLTAAKDRAVAHSGEPLKAELMRCPSHSPV